jgi:hypothetical protein
MAMRIAMRTVSLSLVWALFVTTALCSDKLIVHEWGTFTSFQDERGRAIGGINTDDEPVPQFVHTIAGGLLLSRTELPPTFFQGTPHCHPDVNMRLETPVLYFHADKNFHGRVDVRVEFKGGWLTQFYPDAEAVAPGVRGEQFGTLARNTVGSLTWRNLEVNAAGAGPQTTEAVWTAPRAVEAQQVKTEKGESEKYLFYRGVGHLDAPLSVTRDSGGTLNIAAHESAHVAGVSQLWYADIRKDGSGAYRALHVADNAPVLATTRAEFTPADYAPKAIANLRTEMRGALVTAGLNADEAEALLNTWQISYFKSAGARVFFLVPQEWTDRVMPLSVSGESCEIRRVMVGRIELVSPEQRALLTKIAAGPVPNSWGDFRQPLEGQFLRGNNSSWNALFAGTKTLDEVGFKPPEVWRAYLDLGRFRNALVLDELKYRPSARLKAFVDQFGLKGYEPEN